MDKIKLNQVTLVTVNCDCPDDGIKALRYSMKNIDFGRILLLSSAHYDLPDIEAIDIPNLDSIYKYNDFMLGLIRYINTPYALVIQSDGFIVNAYMWADEFLEYDYIGAPWPNDLRWIEDQREDKQNLIHQAIIQNRIGNGGFSLRSKKFLEYAEQFENCEYEDIKWGEDIFLCGLHYQDAKKAGIKFSPIKLAYKFSYENRCKDFGDDYRSPYFFNVNNHFGFHHCNFTNGQEILNLKNG